MERDWKAEARRLLSGAMGENDNTPRNAADGGIHFHGPVTMVNLFADCADTQGRIIRKRIKSRLDAEGKPTASAFSEELSRAYGKPSVDEMTDTELTDLLSQFDRLVRIARVLAVTPRR